MRKQMIKPMGWWLVAALLGTWTIPGQALDQAIPAAGAEAQITQTFRQLLDGVRKSDAAAVDEAICSDLQSRVRALREARLGLLHNPEDTVALDRLQQSYRAGVYDRLKGFAQPVPPIQHLTISLLPPAAGQPEQIRLMRQGQEITQPIEGSGTLRVSLESSVTMLDIPFMQVEGRWCLLPVAP